MFILKSSKQKAWELEMLTALYRCSFHAKQLKLPGFQTCFCIFIECFYRMLFITKLLGFVFLLLRSAVLFRKLAEASVRALLLLGGSLGQREPCTHESLEVWQERRGETHRSTGFSRLCVSVRGRSDRHAVTRRKWIVQVPVL